ncbi:hypothetical protein ACPJHQ_15405 [Rossellomorea sp. H39__3]
MKVIQLLFIVIALMLVPKPFHALGSRLPGPGNLMNWPTRHFR